MINKIIGFLKNKLAVYVCGGVAAACALGLSVCAMVEEGQFLVNSLLGTLFFLGFLACVGFGVAKEKKCVVRMGGAALIGFASLNTIFAGGVELVSAGIHVEGMEGAAAILSFVAAGALAFALLALACKTLEHKPEVMEWVILGALALAVVTSLLSFVFGFFAEELYVSTIFEDIILVSTSALLLFSYKTVE